MQDVREPGALGMPNLFDELTRVGEMMVSGDLRWLAADDGQGPR